MAANGENMLQMVPQEMATHDVPPNMHPSMIPNQAPVEMPPSLPPPPPALQTSFETQTLHQPSSTIALTENIPPPLQQQAAATAVTTTITPATPLALKQDAEIVLATKNKPKAAEVKRKVQNVRRLTKEQRIFCLQKFWQHQRDHKAIKEAFKKKFPGVEPPTRSTIRNLNEKFEKEGSVSDKARSGRPTSVTSDEKAAEVKKYLSTNKKSTRAACKDLGISKTSMLRIIKKVNIKPSTNDHDYATTKNSTNQPS